MSDRDGYCGQCGISLFDCFCTPAVQEQPTSQGFTLTVQPGNAGQVHFDPAGHATISGHVTVNGAGGSGGSGSVQALTGVDYTQLVGGGGITTQPGMTTSPGFGGQVGVWPDPNVISWNPPAATCFEHTADPDTIFVQDDNIHATCSGCLKPIVIPRVIGGFTFEKAGSLIGRAMTVEDDEDERVGELLAELKLLEDQISKEETKYKRARGLVKIARGVVNKRAIADNAPVS